MKGIKAILGFALATTGIGGAVAVGATSLSNAENNKIEMAEAAYSQGDVIAKDKARIWIGYDTDNPFYSYADANTGIRLWIHSTSSGGTEKVYGTITGTFNNGAESNRRYDYFDIDLAHYTNSWYLTVQKFQNNGWKAATNSIQLKAADAGQVYYVWGDWAWDKTQGTVKPGLVGSADAGFAAKALGGLHTCSSSTVNGYGAFPNIESTFIKNGDDWKTVGNLSDYEINDFAEGDTSYSGAASNTVNAYDKYLYLQKMYTTGGHPNGSQIVLLQNNSTQTIIAISTVALITVGATGGYFFLRKKKHQ